MASSWTIMLALFQMILAGLQGCRGECHSLPEHTDASKIIAAMQGVTQAIEGLGATIQDLSSVMKDQLSKLNENIDNLRKEGSDLSSVMPTNRSLDKECTLDGEQEIRKAMQQYNRTSDSVPLENSLEVLLDHNSLAYRQFQDIRGMPFSIFKVAIKGYMELAKVLVYCGGGVSVTDVAGDTMLHGAVLTSQTELVRLLLDNGADTNAENFLGFPPLISATMNCHLETVKLLVQAGAKTTARDSFGMSAMDHARKCNNSYVVEYLSQFPH